MSVSVSAPPPSDAHAGERLGGRYVLGELLGTGGTASVYQADDVQTGERVAVKVLHPRFSLDPRKRDAFFAEAMAVAGFDHPNIVAVHEVGVHRADGNELAWIAEDLAPGLSAGELLEERRLGVAEALAVAEGVLAALEYAHAQGMVHRDVSPGNVIIDVARPIAPDGVRLVDFGLADAAGRATLGSDPLLAEAPSEGRAHVVGNPHYVSPEQARGHGVDARSDVYQAGAVLYTLLTGEPPYPRRSVEDVMRAHVGSPPPIPSATRPDVPRAVDRIIAKAMATARAQRYPDAREMLLAVAAARGEVAPAATTDVVGVATPRTFVDGAGDAATVVLPAEVAPSRPVAPEEPGRRRPLVPWRPSPGSVLGTVAALAIAGLLTWGIVSYQLRPADVSDDPVATPAPRPTPTETSDATPTAAPPAPLPSAPPTETEPPPVADIAVPNLAGWDLAAVARILTEHGLSVGQVVPRHSTQPRDAVLGTEPGGGTLLAPGSVVDVIVASGSNVVPAVAGLPAADARAAIERAGFVVAAPQPPDDAVITGSAPAADAAIQLGSVVLIRFQPPREPTPQPTGEPTPQPRPTEVPEP